MFIVPHKTKFFLKTYFGFLSDSVFDFRETNLGGDGLDNKLVLLFDCLHVLCTCANIGFLCTS